MPQTLSEIVNSLNLIYPVAEIAIKTGYSKGNVSEFLRNKKEPTRAFLKKLSEVFDIPQKEETYIEKRRSQKNEAQEEPLPYYNTGANAATSDVEIMPAKKQSGVVVSELFKGSKYVIRIAGNSMTPLYPPGGLLGIKPVQMINPGGVYVIESIDGQLWIKRMFYKDDKQDTGQFQLISDNTMKHDCGARAGQLFYPDFFLAFDQVKNLFVVTGVFKSNIITIINEN